MSVYPVYKIGVFVKGWKIALFFFSVTTVFKNNKSFSIRFGARILDFDGNNYTGEEPYETFFPLRRVLKCTLSTGVSKVPVIGGRIV